MLWPCPSSFLAETLETFVTWDPWIGFQDAFMHDSDLCMIHVCVFLWGDRLCCLLSNSKWSWSQRELHSKKNSSFYLLSSYVFWHCSKDFVCITTLSFCNNLVEQELLIPIYRQGNWSTELGLWSLSQHVAKLECKSRHLGVLAHTSNQLHCGAASGILRIISFVITMLLYFF